MSISAVAYLRVSTDDKGQDPERQLEIIRPWAEREGVTVLDVVLDEGTSASKTRPFDRPKFLAACARAQALRADAIVVECSDRFSRQGAKRDAWAECVLEDDYRLKLLRADKPLSAHGSMMGNVSDSMHAENAHAWAKGHAEKVRSGMAKKKRDEGARYGRPPKPLTTAEQALVAKLRADGKGWRRCAHAISRERGAFDVTDPKRSKALRVSHSHVRRCAG